jgi:hypothetical protein
VTLRLLYADGTRFRMIRENAGRGALPRDRRGASAYGEQGHLRGMHRARIGPGEKLTCPQFGIVPNLDLAG